MHPFRPASRPRLRAALMLLAAGLNTFTNASAKSAQPAPAMTAASPEFTHVNVPARIAGLAFSYLRPANFNVVDLPDDVPDFENPTAFFPLQVTMASYGAVVFSIVARPAYGDGTVQDWAEFLARQEKMEITALRPTTLGGLPGMLVEASHDTDAGPMRMRTVLLEDGTRMLNLSIMAPVAIWPSVEPTLQLALTSFRLAEPKGPTVALTRADAEKAAAKNAAAVPAKAAEETPAEEPAPVAAAPASGDVTPAAQLALADDAGSLDPEHPMNVRLRNAAAGLTLRTLRTDEAAKFAVVGAGAIEATFHLPFGWHAIDDGRRTLVFDAAGKIQISLNLRRTGGDAAALLDGLQAENLREQPQIDPLRVDFAADLPGLVLRNYRDGDDVLVQAFLVKHLRNDGLAHVARVTAAPDEMTRAMNLAELIIRTFGTGE